MTAPVTDLPPAEPEKPQQGPTSGSLRNARTLRRSIPNFILIAVLVVLVTLPLLLLLYASLSDTLPRPGAVLGQFTFQHYRGLMSQGNLDATQNSLITASGGTLLALFFGGSTAWFAARTDVPARWMVQLSGIVPLFVSSLVGALAWSLLLSPRAGYLNILVEPLNLPFTLNIYSLWGIIFVFGIYYAPYAFLLIYSALSLMNPELEEAARVHGATDLTTARIVTFPLVKPAVLAAALLTFALTIENFPVPTLLGTPGGIVTLPSFIYRLMNMAPPQANQAAAIGMLLLVALAGVIFVQRRILSKRSYTTVTGKGFRPRRIGLGAWRWPAFAFCAFYVVLAVILPFLALGMMATRSQPFISGPGDLFDLSVLDLDTFRDTLDYEPFKIGIKNSIITGVLAAIFGGMLHLFMAFIVHRTKMVGRTLIEYFAVTPIVVPAIVLGLGMLWTWFLLPFPIYGTLAILVIAFSVRFMPQGFSSISTSLQQVHPDLEESALVSGASRVRAATEVTMPLIRSSIISAMLLLLILSMRELSAAIFLFTSDTRVLSVVIFDFWDSGLFGRAAAASLLYSALLGVVAIFARRYLGAKTGE
jgi:iron(III) transport system permease protein